MTATERPQVDGLHHLKIPVADIAVSLPWYERALGAERIAEFDHIGPHGAAFAYIVRIPGLDTLVELRNEPVMARRIRGFDPIVFGAETHADLQRWASFLDGQQVENSGVLRGILGWLIVFRDPDGLSIRIYCRESHEFDLQGSDIDSPWVTYPTSDRGGN